MEIKQSIENELKEFNLKLEKFTEMGDDWPIVSISGKFEDLKKWVKDCYAFDDEDEDFYLGFIEMLSGDIAIIRDIDYVML